MRPAFIAKYMRPRLSGATGVLQATPSSSVVNREAASSDLPFGLPVPTGCDNSMPSQYALHMAGTIRRRRPRNSPLVETQEFMRQTTSEYNLLFLGKIVFVSLALVEIASAQSASLKYPVNRDELKILIDRGESLAAAGRLAEAEQPLLEAERLAPDDLETITLLAKVQGRIGKTVEAIEGFHRAVNLFPQVADAHLNLGIALADDGQLEEALIESSRAVDLAPQMTVAHLNRGRILDDLHRADEAEKEFTTAYKLAPLNPDCLYYWALAEREIGNLSKESDLLKKMIVVQPNNYKAAYSLGRSLLDQSRHSEAVEALRRALSIKPDYQDALYLLSRELRKSAPEESRQLDEKFQAVRERQTTLDHSKSLGNEAYAAARKKDWPEAIRLLRRALEVCNQCEASAGLHKNLGLALCRNGDIDQGRTELEMALKINPNDPDVVKALEVVGR